MNVLEPDVHSCRIYTPALFLWLSRIIINRVFDLSTMDCVSIKNSIKFIECYVIICLHGCSHTKNLSFVLSIYRDAKLILNDFFWTIRCCWSFVLRYRVAFRMFLVVSSSPVLMPFATMPLAPVLFFSPKFTRCLSNFFP